ncbi:MAG: thioether cross-link-forming SCIFF peptide maturase [Lachnospiraceae bacterium]|nr:thioether cross-link-forming SCIFF peptide maturase [Lachnospiraceae bacterium]
MIHEYKSNGLNIVLDVNSGSVHIVDDLVYEMIPRVEEDLKAGLSDDEIALKYGGSLLDIEKKEAIEEILELKNRGELFAEDEYEPYIHRFTERETVVKAMCLHIAHACNLGCKYCFAGDGEYHGPTGLMSFEVGKRALDFLVENSGSRHNLEVDFFGGEPLLNWDVVKQLVAYGRSIEKEKGKLFRFTLTTNGTLLNDDIMEFVNKEMSNLVLSIDGRKDVHDRMRPYRNGKGSYEDILPKYIKAAESRNQTNYYVRGTYTHFNTDFAADVLHLADMGFKQISVEPVVAAPTESYALTDEDVPGLMEQYDILAGEMIKRRREGKGFNFFHFMIDLEGGPCVYKRLSGCGAGCEYISVTPWGDIYPCHQFVGQEEYKLGDIFKGIEKKDLQKRFHDCNVYSKPECKKCFARYYCSGGCMANSEHFTGDISGAYETGCTLQRKRIECAIMLKAVEAMEE